MAVALIAPFAILGPGSVPPGAGTFDPTAPGPIGGTTPAAGTFTTLTATSTLGVTGVATFNGGVIVTDPSDVTKRITWNIASQTTGKTLTLKAQQTTDQTLAYPNITGADTLGSLGLAQTWTAVQTFVAPVLGTPTSGVLTNCTGTAAGLTAGNVTTNANLTGPITSVGNATSIAAQTGTGTTFVTQASPTLTTPTFQDSSDTTKKLVVLMSAESTGITTTISTGAQTGSRTFSLPVAAGNDTLAALGLTQSFTGICTFSSSSGVVASGAAGLTSSSSGTAVLGVSGKVYAYRVNGTLENIGTMVLQSDPGQATAGIALYTGTTPTRKLLVAAAGSVVFGTAALSTGATDGFPMIPTCAGTPSGTPTSFTGTCAMIYDTTANKLWVYNGSWRGIVLV